MTIAIVNIVVTIIAVLSLAVGIIWSVQHRKFERIVGCEPPNLFGWGSPYHNAEAGSRARRLLRETRDEIKARRAGRGTTMESLEYLEGLEKTLLSLMRFWRINEISGLDVA